MTMTMMTITQNPRGLMILTTETIYTRICERRGIIIKKKIPLNTNVRA